MSPQEVFKALSPLTDEQRIEAQQRAMQAVQKLNGDTPSRDAYANLAVSRYPAWFTKLVAGLLLTVLIAAAFPSFFRLFTAGRDYYLHSIIDRTQADLVGFATFVLAECLVAISTLAMGVYYKGRGKALFVVPIVMGLAVAYIGNWTVVNPFDVFSLLETLVPPSAVLFVALIGERLALEAITTRHANEQAFQAAYAEWRQANQDATKHPRYKSLLANALRDTLRDANSKGTGSTARKELMNTLSTDAWRALVARELAADSWYQDVDLSALAPVEVPAIAPAVLRPVVLEMPVTEIVVPEPKQTDFFGMATRNGHDH